MSYTDTEKMNLARAWAEWVHENPAIYGGTSDRARAAADVVASLPEVVVDGDGLQDLAERIRANVDELDGAGAQPWQYGHLLRQVVAGLEDMLPTHYPAHECAADVLYSVSYGGAVHTAWRVGNNGMPWTVSVGRGTALAADKEVRVLGPVTPGDDADDLTDLREARADDNGARVTLEHVAETDPAYIYTDRDGDEWEYIDGRWITGHTHAERVAGRKIRPGADNLPEEYGPYRKGRLAPESAEQDDEPEFDPAYIYTDRDGDEWEYIDGRWITGHTHAERVARREVDLGRANLPVWYVPYRKGRLATPVAPH